MRNKPINTYILRMPDGSYHAVRTHNIFTYLDNKRSHTKRGYFKQPNLKTARIVFVTKGDYANLIKKFGTAKFMRLIQDYDPLSTASFRLFQ